MWKRMLLVTVLVAGGCLAQNEAARTGAQPAEKKYYRLDFVVKELDGGKIINARSYAMNVATGNERSSIRTGSRLPVPSAAPSLPGAFTFIDVGTNIDCSNVKEVQNQLAMNVSVDLSTAATEPNAPAPVIRQVKWGSPVILPFRKPTVVFSSDDPTSKRQMQLEITARPIQ